MSSITIAAISTDDIINAVETLSSLPVSGTTSLIQDGQIVTVVLNGNIYTTTVTTNAWTLNVPQGDVAVLPDGVIQTVTADVSDVLNVPAPQATRSLAVDLSAPTVTFDLISSDNIVNAVESGSALTISGTTTGVEDNQSVSVVLNSKTYTGTVTSNVWTLSVPQGDVAALPDGVIQPVTADVSDLAGNPATPATASLTVDLSAPTVTFDLISSDNIVNAVESGSALTISGTTTGVEDNQSVSVVLNSKTYTGTVTSNVWTLSVPQGDVAALPDGVIQPVTADVSDLAGNPATQVTASLTVDLSAPTVTFDLISSDNIVNAVESGSALTISGTTTGVEDNQSVSVVLNSKTYTGTVTSNVWTLSVPQGDVAALPDGVIQPVTADVSDLAGNPATQVTASLTVDLLPPTIAFDLISSDNIVNAVESGSALTISGTTTGVEDNQSVSVVLNSKTYTGTVTSNVWTLSVPQGDVAALPDGVIQPVTADVSDLAGNPATPATASLTVDLLPPTIAFDLISSDNIVNAVESGSALTISGTTTGVEDNQSVSVVLNSKTYTGTVTSNVWTLSVPQGDVAVLPDGTSPTVTADVSDVAGNPAPQATQGLKIDETAPSVTISTIATDNTINKSESGSALTIAGTTIGAENGQTVTVGLNGKTYTGTVAGNAWTVTVSKTDVGALADGASLTVSADVSDLAGNPATQATQGLKIDETAPSITISTIATDNIINAVESGSALTVGGTTSGAEDGQSVTVGLNGKIYTGTVSGDAWTATVSKADVAALADGASLPVTADVSDLAGNPAIQATQTLTIDETAPSITISTIATDNIINAVESGSALTVGGTTTGAEDGQSVTVGLNGKIYTGTVSGDAWTATVSKADVAALADGASLPVTANVSDFAGNPAIQATQTLTIDETAPSITIATIATDNIINAVESGSALTVGGTTSGAEDGQSVTVGLNGKIYTGTVSGDAWTATVSKADVAALADGASLPVTADVSDFAGNPAIQATQTLTIDETAPSITISTIATDNIINAVESGSALTVGGTTSGAEDGQSVTVGLNGKIYTGTVSGNAWTATVSKADVAALADGANLTVTADVSDFAGNPATQATRNLTIDETAPSITISTITTDNIINAVEAKSALTVGGTTSGAENGRTVTVGLNGKFYTGTVAGNAWTVSVSKADVGALADGANLTVTANVSDLAGNPATQATQGLKIDETAPSVTISTIATDNIISAVEAKSALTVAGTTSGAENGRTVTVGLNGKIYTGTVAGNAWTVSVSKADVGALADGANLTVTADVSDLAGNPATQATHGLKIDETAPSITISALSTDDIVNAVEAGSPLAVAGTTNGAENGRTVTVGLNGKSYTTTVLNNAWTVSVLAVDLASLRLPDGGYTVTADVADIAGNSATQATRSLTVDETSPGISINPIAGDNTLNALEATVPLSVGGIADGVEDGQHVTIGLNGTNYDATVLGSAWTTSIAAADLASAVLPDGSYTVTADLADMAGNPATQATRSLTVDQSAPANNGPSVALSNTMTSDVFFQHDSGSVAIWQLGGGTLTASGQIGLNPGAGWHIRGLADFFGNHDTNILWQNADGSVAIWDMKGSTIAAGGIVGFNPGTDWQAMGTGNFFGRSTSDILWQNRDGSVAIWNMNGTTIASGQIVGFNPGANWQVQGSGDFFRNGHSDILWQNTDGSVAIWDMVGSTIVGGGVVGFNPGPSWHIKGAGAFFGTGDHDIAFQNDDGSVALWRMNGTTIAGGGVVGLNAGPSWHLMGTGNFFGSGNNSLLFQNDDGSIAVWGMNGTTIAQAGVVGPNLGSSWHAYGNDGMRFIDGTSGTGTLTATGQPDEFVLTSFVFGPHAIAGFDVGHDSIELSKTLFPALSDVQSHATDTGSGTLIDLGNSNSLLLQGVPLNSLHSNNFVLI